MSISTSSTNADASEFYDALRKVVGDDNATLYSKRFHPLSGNFGDRLYNYEGLAFFAYTTALEWHEKINSELWGAHPSPEIIRIRDVLNEALAKLPIYKMNDGTVYRGYRTRNLDTFLKTYSVGTVVHFPGFTSAAFKEENAFGGNVLFIIRALTARAVWYVSARFDEYEVLIPAGRSFWVRDVERVGDRAVVTIDEVQ